MLAQLSSVTKQYEKNGPLILDKVSLPVYEDDAIAITGPSGSGKSTLLNILGTLDTPTSGEVRIDGKDTVAMSKTERAGVRNRFIGFVFQQHHLLPQLTLLENVLVPTIPLGRSRNRTSLMDRATTLMRRAGLEDLMNKFPGKASVGECQRTAVVRALINSPSLLLADEPTGSLDNDNAVMLAQLLLELNREQKCTMIIVTHSADIASMLKNEYRLHSGKLTRIR